MVIVCSGNGYLVKFVKGMPLMTSDPIIAARVSRNSGFLLQKIQRLGFDAYSIQLRFARTKP